MPEISAMTDLFTGLPWVALLVVFGGMAALQWRVINALDQALARTVTPPPAPAPRLPAPAAPVAPGRGAGAASMRPRRRCRG
jgi:hypothetical protein